MFDLAFENVQRYNYSGGDWTTKGIIWKLKNTTARVIIHLI